MIELFISVLVALVLYYMLVIIANLGRIGMDPGEHRPWFLVPASVSARLNGCGCQYCR
jgi:hypothetical protein